jgi:DNA-binding IclR family transcriptional regulator
MSADLPPAEANRLHRDLATAVVAFQEAVARRVGMTAAERKCVGILAELGPTTPGRLAEATGLTTGAITGIVDRLERAGFAAREPHPSDRRSILVRACRTDRLAELSGPAFASLTKAMSGLVASYTPEERAIVARHLAETTAILREETARVAAMPPPGR